MTLNPSMRTEGIALSKMIEASRSKRLTVLTQQSLKYDGLYETMVTQLTQDYRVDFEIFHEKGTII